MDALPSARKDFMHHVYTASSTFFQLRLRPTTTGCHALVIASAGVMTLDPLDVCLVLDLSVSRRFTLCPADRLFPSVREEVPLPSHPPFTAFIGNLAFDITEDELASFFNPHQVRGLLHQDLQCPTYIQAKSIKIIKDRDDKPKGFGYIEFAELDALKDALSRTGSVSYPSSSEEIHLLTLLSESIRSHYSS